tara:strand:+ start:132 stop:644 length:513 start_codon:yes stop_codon:yes gene_type:complete
MKKFLITFVLFIILSVNSHSQIAYIDMNFVLSTSKAGKALNKYIKEIRDEYLINYKQIEKNLIQKEQKLIAQQNILDKSEFEKKLSKLSIEINKYRSDKKKSEESLNKIKLKNTKEILKLLNPIITQYVDTNSISLVIPKKNIIVGKKNLDITNDIIILLNDQATILNFK